MVRRWWWSRNGFQQGTDLNLVLSLARPLFLASPSATYTFDTIMPTRHAVLSLVLAAVTLVLAACATRPVLEPAGVSVIRTYRFSTNVPDPQPAWNPKSHVIVARSLGGFSVLQEGQGRQELFESTESRQTWYPQWLNRNQFVFGPMRNVSPVTDGRVVPATDGLTVVTLEDTGLRYNVRREALSAVGYRPRVADGLIYAQVESKQVVIDTQGKVSDATAGVRLVSLREPQAAEQLLTATGSHPLWSHDGLRILSIEQSEDRPATIVVSVLIAKPTLP